MAKSPMANLDVLYKESGLQGIIPYAFGMSGHGYDFLCKKLMEGTELFVITADATDMPFFDIDGDHIYFSLYSSKEQAEAKCNKLARNKSYTHAVSIPTEYAGIIWKRYRDLGISHLYINDAIWVSIRDLAPVGTYEGILNIHTPLRNPTLNFALYIFLQAMEAGDCPSQLTAFFWDTFKTSSFYVPVAPTRDLRPGEPLDAENSDFHFVETENGPALLIFTDEEFKNIYGESYNISQEDYQVVNVATWKEIKEYLDAHSLSSTVVNLCAGSLNLSPENVAYFEMASLNQAALQHLTPPG